MSLVAYGASDDSESSDGEEVAGSGTKTNQSSAVGVQTAVVYNNNAVTLTGTVTEKVAVHGGDESRNKNNEASTTHVISDEDEPSDFLKALPAPKTRPAAAVEVVEDDELEDLVKPKPTQVADITLPSKKNSKGRQPVRISIPALSKDADDEDDEPKKKKFKTSGKGCGLFSLLPPPQNVSVKETNRVLLPYTLKKTAKPSSTSQAKSVKKNAPKPATVNPLGISVDSDSDEETESGTVCFFSLSDSTTNSSSSSAITANRIGPLKLPPPSLPTSTLPTSEETHTLSASTIVTTSTLPSASGKNDSASSVLCGPVLPTNNSSEEQLSTSTSTTLSSGWTESLADPSQGEDEPLAFNTTATSEDAPLSFRAGHTMAPYVPRPHAYHQQPTNYSHLYQQHSQYVDYPDPSMQSNPSDVEKYLQDEEFLKLQGKKQQGREQVNIIDVDTNQFTSTQDLMKTLTVEQEHTSHRKKDNQPSGRQRSKHQITYLAFQAKERELTLKNQWAQNKQTKRQTQSKYGF